MAKGEEFTGKTDVMKLIRRIKMSKFKIGDRVKAIRAVNDNEKIVNKIGKIIVVTNEIYERYGVEFDEPINGHSCCGAGKMRFCWWLDENDIVPVTQFKVGQVYKVGFCKDDPNSEAGNIIKITDIYGNICRYETLKGKNLSQRSFGDRSPFAKCLEPVNQNKIVITTDGITTTAKLYDGKTVVKIATAKCSPDDEFNFETGARIAFDRLTLEIPKAPTNVFDWDEFKTKPVCVLVNEDNAKFFMDEARKHNLSFGIKDIDENLFCDRVKRDYLNIKRLYERTHIGFEMRKENERYLSVENGKLKISFTFPDGYKIVKW